jgi:hypothetical protein
MWHCKLIENEESYHVAFSRDFQKITGLLPEKYFELQNFSSSRRRRITIFQYFKEVVADWKEAREAKKMAEEQKRAQAEQELIKQEKRRKAWEILAYRLYAESLPYIQMETNIVLGLLDKLNDSTDIVLVYSVLPETVKEDPEIISHFLSKLCKLKENQLGHYQHDGWGSFDEFPFYMTVWAMLEMFDDLSFENRMDVAIIISFIDAVKNHWPRWYLENSQPFSWRHSNYLPQHVIPLFLSRFAEKIPLEYLSLEDREKIERELIRNF